MSNNRLLLGRKNAKMRYSAAYPTGQERMLVTRYGCAGALSESNGCLRGMIS